MNAKTPIAAWSVLFSEEIFKIIVKHTNKEISRRIYLPIENKARIDTSVHKQIEIVELNPVIVLLYYASVHKLSKSETINWWGVHCMPLFKATMSRNRFTFILDCLHFDDKSTRAERKANDRFTQIREIWDLFIKNCMDNMNSA